LDDNTVLVFARYGMGDAPSELQKLLAGKLLALIENAKLPEPRFSSTLMA
jgi:hypothetical protein